MSWWELQKSCKKLQYSMCVQSQECQRSHFTLPSVTPDTSWHSSRPLGEKTAPSLSLGRAREGWKCGQSSSFLKSCLRDWFLSAWLGALMKPNQHGLDVWGPLKARESGGSLLWYQRASRGTDRGWVWFSMIGRRIPTHDFSLGKKGKE